ncbi:MAG TPA: hypothetical protein PLP17_07825, partial [Oligoflexia bacterium]|nr:hypothetical protein [Oligoflexia bacterium]
IDSAKWFIDAIKQRQHTLLSTMNAIMEHQYEFFLTGDETELKPMILKDIAEKTGLDISTDGATPGDDQNVISASVSQIGRGECQATITNTSNVNSYSVSFKVVGRNERGSKLVDKSYSASLKPQQKVTRQMDCPAEANMEVVLQSARKTNK